MQNDSPRLLGLLLSVSRPDSPGKILYEAISLRLSFSRLPPQLSVVFPCLSSVPAPHLSVSSSFARDLRRRGA